MQVNIIDKETEMLINSIKCLLMDIIMAGKVDPERDTKAKTMTSYKKKCQ